MDLGQQQILLTQYFSFAVADPKGRKYGSYVTSGIIEHSYYSISETIILEKIRFLVSYNVGDLKHYSHFSCV